MDDVYSNFWIEKKESLFRRTLDFNIKKLDDGLILNPTQVQDKMMMIQKIKFQQKKNNLFQLMNKIQNKRKSNSNIRQIKIKKSLSNAIEL